MATWTIADRIDQKCLSTASLAVQEKAAAIADRLQNTVVDRLLFCVHHSCTLLGLGFAEAVFCAGLGKHPALH
jgi:hypothetical protein